MRIVDCQAQLSHPVYKVVASSMLPFKGLASWPDITSFNHYLRVPGFRFVLQSSAMANYEQHIYRYREIPTRANNWHDWFNALIWQQFPNSKKQLNQLQYRDMLLSPKVRTHRQNLFAHFDEDGLIVTYHDTQTPECFNRHAWQTLFCQPQVGLSYFAFGHGLLEKMLNPYIGLTAKAILIRVDTYFEHLAWHDKILYLDKLIASMLTNHVYSLPKTTLQPVPILGIPGWYSAQSSEFYQNTHYFRPKTRYTKSIVHVI